MDDVPAMLGADALKAWFGYWPSFHDAEVHALSLNRQGMSLLTLQAWHMTDCVDERGYFVNEKYALVTFHMGRLRRLR